MSDLKVRKWTRKDWILVTPGDVMHLLKGCDHPLCRKTMPKGVIVKSAQELDDFPDYPDGKLRLLEICRNCQTIFTGERA